MISEIYSEFILEQKFRNNSEKTIEWYADKLNNFFTWLKSDDTSTLSLENFKQYGVYLQDTVKKHNGDKLAASSVQNEMRAVKAFYNYSIEQGYIEDCSRKLKLPIRAYLLTSLYNSLSTMSSYYQAEVNHDVFGG